MTMTTMAMTILNDEDDDVFKLDDANVPTPINVVFQKDSYLIFGRGARVNFSRLKVKNIPSHCINLVYTLSVLYHSLNQITD